MASAMESLVPANWGETLLTGTIAIIFFIWILSKPQATVQVAGGLAQAYATGVKALTPQ